MITLALIALITGLTVIGLGAAVRATRQVREEQELDRWLAVWPTGGLKPRSRPDVP